jgi:hypothetical protein
MENQLRRRGNQKLVLQNKEKGAPQLKISVVHLKSNLQ